MSTEWSQYNRGQYYNLGLGVEDHVLKFRPKHQQLSQKNYNTCYYFHYNLKKSSTTQFITSISRLDEIHTKTHIFEIHFEGTL